MIRHYTVGMFKRSRPNMIIDMKAMKIEAVGFFLSMFS